MDGDGTQTTSRRVMEERLGLTFLCQREQLIFFNLEKWKRLGRAEGDAVLQNVSNVYRRRRKEGGR